MRDVTTLLSLEDIKVLWQYLYMDKDHYITIDNGLTQLEIRMRANGSFHAKNLKFPSLPDLEYTDMMTLPNMLGIIDQLKSNPPVDYEDTFKSRWEELRSITLANVGLAKTRLKT